MVRRIQAVSQIVSTQNSYTTLKFFCNLNSKVQFVNGTKNNCNRTIDNIITGLTKFVNYRVQ